MSRVIDSIERAQLRRVPSFQAGDRLRVHFQVVEGTRRRTQVFEGIVLKRQGSGARETFTVRKQSFGVGVERTFPVHSPKIERIEVAARGDVRRAKLYYLRDRVGRSARVRERRFGEVEEDVYSEGVMPPPGADEAAVEAEAAGDDPRDEGVEEVIEQEAETTAEAEEAGPDAEEAGPDATTEEPEAGAEPAEPEAEQAEPEADPEAGADAAAEAEGEPEADAFEADGDAEPADSDESRS